MLILRLQNMHPKRVELVLAWSSLPTIIIQTDSLYVFELLEEVPEDLSVRAIGTLSVDAIVVSGC